ncbi:MAG: DUF2029 domain-containing protein [Proteobacteria bacterium]|nr:DUF2029 domain-containing protein [Pseudomonadota bacterium]
MARRRAKRPGRRAALAPRGTGRPGAARRARWWLLLPLAALHLALVVDVARQPLATEATSASHRAVIWPLHNDTIHRIGPGADFFAVYHAGQALAAGLDPYQQLETPRRTPYWFPFRYLPLVGQTLGRAASAFAPQTAYLLWLALTELMLLGLVGALLARQTRVAWQREVALGALLLSSPYLLELHMGQFTFVTVAAVALAVLLDARGPAHSPARWSLRLGAALAYTGALLLKLFPAVAIPALLRQRRYWPLLALALGALTAALLNDFAGHPQRLRTFWELNFSQPVGGMDGGNVGLVYAAYLALERLWPAWHAAHWSSFLGLWRIGVLGASALVVLLARGRDLSVGVALLLLGHFVSYAHVWEHHTSGVLVLGVLLLLAEAPGAAPQPRRPRWDTAVVVAALVLLALPTPFALFDLEKDPRVVDPSAAWPLAARYLVVLSKALPTAALFVVALSRQLKGGKAAAPATAAGQVAGQATR